MHELSLCEAIARAVTREAGGRRISAVRLRIGAMRQVVPDTLIYCWSITSRGPILDGSVLEIEYVAAEVQCRVCGTRSELSRLSLCCPSCGASEVAVVAGEEMLIVSIDVDETVDASANAPSGPAGEAAGYVPASADADSPSAHV